MPIESNDFTSDNPTEQKMLNEGWERIEIQDWNAFDLPDYGQDQEDFGTDVELSILIRHDLREAGLL